MANKVFISFRFSDGEEYKRQLEMKFEELNYVINKSENEDRSGQSEETIKEYLYDKLQDTSLTIVVLSPKAIEYNTKYNSDGHSVIDDWIYDELRYSLENRSGNKTNAVIALYTPEAKSLVISSETEEVTIITDFNNLVRKNMLNIKDKYKFCKENNKWNSLKDTYISLVAFDLFIKDPKTYIDNAIEKRERIEQFNLVVRMQ